MQLQFDANQEFQLQAIAAVADLFAGQPRIATALTFGDGASFAAAVANRLDLGEAELLANLQAVQQRGHIAPDAALACIEQEVESNGSAQAVRFYNFSVEMETGTGKTYVYLRTLLELYRRYGLRKFIVVVPSLAIREGVLKTLAITRGHLQALYGNVPYRFYAYDSASISQVRQFALADGVEVMVMTIAAFNRAANVIRQSTDRLQGATPIHLVQATRPILILDEPQNMESEKSIAALAALHPLFALRYSATHRNPYNIVYRLTPYEAYRQGLVKRIEVDSVVREDSFAQPYIRLEGIEARKRTLTARVTVHALMRSGSIAPQTLTLRPGDSLHDKARRSEYAGYEVDEISLSGRLVRFANKAELHVGEELGADKEAVFEAQIRTTVAQHLERQQRLRAQGIKVLSLFFIDRVDNYAPQGSLIRRLFARAFDDLKRAYPDWRARSAAEVQAAYFAQRRTRSGEVILEDSTSGEAEKDREVYDLIMKDKERLLSFDEPVAFIFSHSALREGWDNPNVFQICTLSQTASEVRKRQEVGRGVRLAVNQAGVRVRDERVNVLTVVANESYDHFVRQLQSEIAFEYQAEIAARYGKPLDALSAEERARVEQEYGHDILPPRPANAHQRAVSHLRKAYQLRPEFQELWDKIRQKTRYHVAIDSDRLVREVVAGLAEVQIRPPRITLRKAVVDVTDEGAFVALTMSGAKTLIDLAGRYPLPNLLDVMGNLLEQTTPPVRLTRRTLLAIIRQAPPAAQQAMVSNPTEFAQAAVAIIKDRLAGQLIDGIKYDKIGEWYEMAQFDAEVESWQGYLVPSRRPDGTDGASLYDQVPCESDIERRFVEGLEQRQDVRLYIKLPRWFTVDTPIGAYNPDWAIVMDNPEGALGKPLLYLVRETKGSTKPGDLRPDEARRIRCGRRHFEGALGVDYEVVSSAEELS
ncbi:MAG TPA: DEAD/DEAH box helicase family protein [Anaerolineae bacterium]|nr:DEAD/DEAH box helicase family protein [Anaerolineae bacterium]HPL28147.1 DEAD/DEAH box helicase family protein [Anaerolineae bacterium]